MKSLGCKLRIWDLSRSFDDRVFESRGFWSAILFASLPLASSEVSLLFFAIQWLIEQGSRDCSQLRGRKLTDKLSSYTMKHRRPNSGWHIRKFIHAYFLYLEALLYSRISLWMNNLWMAIDKVEKLDKLRLTWAVQINWRNEMKKQRIALRRVDLSHREEIKALWHKTALQERWRDHKFRTTLQGTANEQGRGSGYFLFISFLIAFYLSRMRKSTFYVRMVHLSDGNEFISISTSQENNARIVIF